MAIQQQAAAGTGAAADADAPDVRLVGVRKAYGDVVAVDGVDLEIASGEFFTLLGPSGSGKTTTLRLIAGFERPDAGRIELGGKDVTTRAAVHAGRQHGLPGLRALPAHDRRRERRLRPPGQGGARRERRLQVEEILKVVQLPGLGDRKPIQLSGGQRQRVALARALVNHPQVLLLDEPLGALDLKLRQEMQIELKRIQREVGITFVYVTHDQEEALTMSDRLAVFNEGRIEQIGSPAEVYERPQNEFVAGFVGVSNVVERGRPRLHGSPGEDPHDRRTGGLVGRRARVEQDGFATSSTSACSRVHVELDDGGELVVVRQNLETSSRRPSRPRATGPPSWSPEHANEMKPETGGEARAQ